MKFQGRLQRSEWAAMLCKVEETKFSRRKTIEWLKRVQKRAKAARGEDVSKEVYWSYDFIGDDNVRYAGRLAAPNRSEARGRIKKFYSLKRIPPHANIVNKGKSPKLAKDPV